MTPAEIRGMSNPDYLGLLAYLSLQAEREHHAGVHARASRPRRR